jgi:HSP20 family protein
MNLIPRNNWFDIEKSLDRFFEPSSLQTMSNGILSPRVDIKDKNDHFEITAEMPGIKKDDIQIGLDNGVLSIEASTSEEKTEEKEGKVIRKERFSGKMMRSFSLGKDINEKDISANFENGVLTLQVPKKDPKQISSRKIDIR